MKRFSQSGCGIQPRPVGSKSRAAILALVFLPLISHAIVDKNSDGISDVWEQQYNSGQLFVPPLDPAADADHDGWTNAQEAASGTNPFDSNPPAGFLRPEVINIPGVWGDPDANGDPVPISPNTLRVSWQTIPGKQYTLLYSPDLTASSWLPVEAAFIGTGAVTEYNFPLTEPTSTFWRVKIEDADSDGDALTDAEEYVFATDAANPTTVSGIPDLWLAENFASVLMNAGYSYIDPNADPDGDGASNAEEASSGTDPNTSNPATDHHWVRVTGNGEFGEAVTRSGTLTIPAGESRIMIVVIASDEFPEYTGTPSEFNDLLVWNAVPSQGASIQGSIEVNSRHAAWEAAITNDTSLPGFPSPVHIEEISFLTAPPDSALTIQIDVSATNVSDGQLPSHVAMGLLPVEIVIPKVGASGSEVAGEVVNATELKVSKMEQSLTIEKNMGIIIKEELDISKDIDRFYVHIPGGAALAAGNMVSVKLKTVGTPETEYNDDETEIDLKANGDDLISKSLMLTSDVTDDSFKGAIDVGEENKKNDRTHIVQLGGKLVISKVLRGVDAYDINFEKSVEVKKKVRLDFVILDDGIIDIQEIKDTIERDLKRANEIYAQVGIQIIQEGDAAVVPVPTGIALEGGVLMIDSSAGSKRLSSSARTIIEDCGTEEDASDLQVFYVPFKLKGGGGFTDLIDGVAIDAGGFDKPEDSGYLSNVFMTKCEWSGTLSHEVGHILTAGFHVEVVDYPYDPEWPKKVRINLMSGAPSIDPIISHTKRFLKFQEDKMKISPHAKNP